MNIDNYLDIILTKHIDKPNICTDDLLNPLIYNKMLDSVSYNTKQKIIITDKDNLYLLNTDCFDIIKDITTDSDISLIITGKEINNLQNLTLPTISIKSKIYIKLANSSNPKVVNIYYKGYVLNSIPRLEFLSYYNKYNINNNYGLEFVKGNLNNT